jgi:hypothetical protein
MSEIFVVTIVPKYCHNGHETVDSFISCFYDRRTAIDFMIESVDEIYEEIKDAIDDDDEISYPSFDKEDIDRIMIDQGEYVFECKQHLEHKFIYSTYFKIQATDII